MCKKMKLFLLLCFKNVVWDAQIKSNKMQQIKLDPTVQKNKITECDHFLKLR